MTSQLDPTQRFDPFLPVHKAMRHVMFEVLTQVGALDASDIFAVDRCARQVARLTALLPDAAPLLLPLLDALHQRDPGRRQAAAACLYREVTALVTDQLARQQRLEAEQTPLLHARHDDATLREMRRGKLGAASEGELAEALRAMACALSPQELSSVLDDVQASVDAQTFGCLLDTARRQTSAERWTRVARESGLSDAHAVPELRRRRVPGAHRTPTPTPQRRSQRVEKHRGPAQ